MMRKRVEGSWLQSLEDGLSYFQHTQPLVTLRMDIVGKKKLALTEGGR